MKSDSSASQLDSRIQFDPTILCYLAPTELQSQDSHSPYRPSPNFAFLSLVTAGSLIGGKGSARARCSCKSMSCRVLAMASSPEGEKCDERKRGGEEERRGDGDEVEGRRK